MAQKQVANKSAKGEANPFASISTWVSMGAFCCLVISMFAILARVRDGQIEAASVVGHCDDEAVARHRSAARLKELRDKLKSPNFYIAERAARAIGRLGKDGAPALESLGVAASARHEAVALAALQVFDDLAKHDRELSLQQRGVIEYATRDSREEVALLAREVLGHLDRNVAIGRRFSFEGMSEAAIIEYVTKCTKAETLARAREMLRMGSDAAPALVIAGVMCFSQDAEISEAFNTTILKLSEVCPEEKKRLIEEFEGLARSAQKQQMRQRAAHLLTLLREA